MRLFHHRSSYLLLIILLAAILRLYHLSTTPISMNPDEVALGYNSYSILKTGADEHGVFMPMSLQSFGDWKLPGYSYVSIIPIALFGLSAFSTRLLSALAGIVGVYLIYVITKRLFKKELLSLFAALFYALSPWNIYFSRAAYEVNLATTFFLAGITFLLLYLDKQKKQWQLFASAVCFGITVFTYYSYVLFLPLFLIGLGIFYFRQIKNKQPFISPLLLFVLFFIGSFFATSAGGNKVSTLNIFNDPNVLYNRVDKIRGDGAKEPAVLQHVLHNKLEGGLYQLAQNYLLSFSPSFLFDQGGEKLVHNLGTFGNLYLFDSVLLVVGILSLFWFREKALPILILWLVLAPIPSSITKDTPNSTRLFILMPLFTIISAYGAYTFFEIFKKNSFKNVAAKLVLVVLFVFNVLLFLDLYFIHFNIERAEFWHYGTKQAVDLTNKYPSDQVYFRGSENFPYIYFLFYNKYDPALFRKEVQYYPPTSEGFLYVKSFGRYHFPNKINYDKLSPNSMYIDDTMLGDKKHAILLPDGEPILGYEIK